MAGVGRYWTFIELCASKMEKERDEEFTDAHCYFEFDKTFLMRALGYHNHVHLMCYLGDMQVIGMCSVSDKSMTVVCHVPKLLECMAREYKRARPRRVLGGPKKKIEIKEEDKEREDADILPFDDPPPKPKQPALSQVNSADDVLKSMPIVRRDLLTQKFGESFVREEVHRAFDWHMANPSAVPNTPGRWQQKIMSWFNRIADQPEHKGRNTTAEDVAFRKHWEEQERKQRGETQ
jgi:hypothetical protein